MMNNILNWKHFEEHDFFFEGQKKEEKSKNRQYQFSIVVAVYNSEEYIEETIESVLNQDFDFSKIQLILVDDGSTDKSFDLCKSYAIRYPENIILIHKENGGVSSARNVGTYFAEGKYINFLDSDDKFGKNVCSEVYKFFEVNQKRVDVVTIKVEIFGDKTGESWYNKKFEKGNRVINLFNEPAIYLNSTNSTFFHKRIKNQLYFDENLTIAEDLKVVNTVLMNKYALGVLNTCSYYYRIRLHNSLVSTAKVKNVWYLPYLERVYFWLYEKSMKQTGRFLEFLQYTLLRELYNRINENTECIKVLQDQTLIDIYKSTLFRALFLIDDKIIRKCGFINTDFMLYIFSKKYGKPIIDYDNGKLNFTWKNGIKIEKKLYAKFEMCSVVYDELVLEGYVIVNNIGYTKDECLVYYSLNDDMHNAEIIKHTSNDLLAFADEYILYRRYFKIKICLPKEKINIKFWLHIGEANVPYQIYGYGEWFGVDKNLLNAYYYDKHFLLSVKENILYIEKAAAFFVIRREILLLKELKSIGKKDKKYYRAFLARLYHDIMNLMPHRPVWIISDRCISAGDNGEAFYSYCRRKKWINSYFAINQESIDYKRLKKKRFKLLTIGSNRYKTKYLLATKIISAHFDNSELRPALLPGMNDVIAKKMHVFLQHGITKDDVSKFYSRKRQKIDKFIVAANPEYESIISNTNYFCDRDNVCLTGFPRYDKLYLETEKIILIMPTWRNDLVTFGSNSKNAKISKDFLSSYYYAYFHELMVELSLDKLVKKLGYKIYYFPHSNMLETNSYFSDIAGIEIVTNTERNYTNIFARAAIMVTDYSSTAFDFAYLRKPIIYCQGDYDGFFKSHTYSKGYFDYEQDGFGKVVLTVADAIKELHRIMGQNCKVDGEYLDRINQFFKFIDRENSKRVFTAITEKI